MNNLWAQKLPIVLKTTKNDLFLLKIHKNDIF
jgi:hypothetical protein